MDQNPFKGTAVGGPERFDFDSLFAIIAEEANRRRAGLKDKTTNPQANFVKVGPIPLDSAPLNPYPLPGPIKSIVLKDTTDSTVRVSLVLGTDAGFAVQNAYPMDINESINFEEPVPKGYLTWTAQSGKTATLYVGIDAEVRPGKIVSVSSGGVNLSDGDAVTSETTESANETASIIVAASTSRKVATVQNQGSIPIYVGGSTVTGPSGARPGIQLVPGASLQWRNAAALYAITATGSGTNSNLAVLTES